MRQLTRFIRRALLALAAFAALVAYMLHCAHLGDAARAERMRELEPHIELARSAEEGRAALESFAAAKAAGRVRG
ncbi:hypothetical protein [Collinsella sp. D33t1_170424_A12]|uniref:hypothetical protein n=1 Tax=Collinsella sp. D33t1_170424_A12 TaxID=2787135 RepID=UPI00189BA43B|nr:hypothetical protein [Collinsella sp. D33t1_170424_A12]